MSSRSSHTALRATLVVAALVAPACGHRDRGAAPALGGPTVATVQPIRGATEALEGETATRIVAEQRLAADHTIRLAEGARGALTLDSGAWILADQGTTVEADAIDAITLTRGRIWVDALHATPTVVHTPRVDLTVCEGGFAVECDDTHTTVYVGDGELNYHVTAAGIEGEAEGTVQQGEGLEVSTSVNLAARGIWDDWTGGLADPARAHLVSAPRVGSLAGRTVNEIGSPRVPLPVRSHTVNVAIEGDLALTTVTQVFFNARSETLEGVFRLRVPDGALVERFEVDMGGGFVVATPAPIGAGGGYLLTWRDASAPESRLVYDGPHRLRARVSPIVPGATVGVRVRYVEWLRHRDGTHTYTYPMRSDDDPPLLGEFVLDVDASHANPRALRAGLGAVVDGQHAVLRASDYRAHADFTVELVDRETDDARATAYVVGAVGASARGDDAAFVLVDVPTADLVESEDTSDAPLDVVLLLDVSGGTEPEELDLARGVVESVLRQLAPTDRVALRLADVHAHLPAAEDGSSVGDESLHTVDDATREALLASIARTETAGATDLGTSLRDAAALVAGRPRAAVIYLGDGVPTTGAMSATELREQLGSIDGAPRFFALGLGDGSNIELLRTLFGDGASLVHTREDAARLVMRVLALAGQPSLRDLRIDLGDSVERVYPRSPISAPTGEHVQWVGRLVERVPSTVTVRGTKDGVAFERELTVQRRGLTDSGDIPRRWAHARMMELVDRDAGREALVDIGTRFGIVTPWTSLALGGTPAAPVQPVTFFDSDPLATPYGLGGGAARALDADAADAWRRRVPRAASAPAYVPEATWERRTAGTLGAVETNDDGGIARQIAARALQNGERGPQSCYERRSIVRPDLAGDVSVSVAIDRAGAVSNATIVSSSIRDREVESCVQNEVRGLRFPEGRDLTVTHIFHFQVPEREFGGRRQCSDASRQPLDVRRELFVERLSQVYGPAALIEVYRAARAACELPDFRSRRAMLNAMLDRTSSIQESIAIAQAFAGDGAIYGYLRQAILRRVRSPGDIPALRAGLGLDPYLDWRVFLSLYDQANSPEAKLRVVRRWLEGAPEDLELRLRLLQLLEDTNALVEARRVARSLRADSLADARVRTEVGEFWLRQERPDEAKRVFSEIVEHAPFDPWARRRLGDLYRAHAWFDDAYREYGTLTMLRPDAPEILLLRARAAEGAGRLDEALRLARSLSETSEPGDDDHGAATTARLWSWQRLLRLAAAEPERRSDVEQRVRESGVLRDPPAILAMLVFDHPDDCPAVAIHHPDFEDANRFEPATLGSCAHGLFAVPVSEREEGRYVFRITRSDTESLRPLRATFVVLVRPGAPDAVLVERAVELDREHRTLRIGLDGDRLVDIATRTDD